ENPLGVARPAAEDQPAFLAAREKRRDTVEVRRQDDARRLSERGQHVEAVVRDRLLGDLITARSQKGPLPPPPRGRTAGGGIDVDETAGEKDWIDVRNRLQLSKRREQRPQASSTAG